MSDPHTLEPTTLSSDVHQNPLCQNAVIVEDDDDMARMLEYVLDEAIDHTVSFTDQAHAIDQARDYFLSSADTPDIAIIDIILNGEGGLDLYDWMMDHEVSTQVIFLTGCHPQSDEYRRAEQTGAPIYDKDQFDPAEFVGYLEHLLDEDSTESQTEPP